jgi:hypothetical protein
VLTRPEPTIYGNCDSWDFIVWISDPKQRPLAGKLCTTYQQSRDNFTEQHVGELWTQCQHLAWWILMAGNDGFDLCSRGTFLTFMTTVTELMPYFCRFDVEKNFLGRPQGPG